MERLLAGDVLLDRESAMPIAAGGSFNNLVHNVFYLSSRVVDKLWQGKGLVANMGIICVVYFGRVRKCFSQL